MPANRSSLSANSARSDEFSWCIGGLETDQAALRFIAPLLANKKADITLLYVQEDRQREEDEHVQAALQKGAGILREFDYEPLTKVARGDFVEEILKDVAVQRYDLVVLGAYGRTQSKYLSLISDEALNLARLTTRPILVYRNKILRFKGDA